MNKIKSFQLQTRGESAVLYIRMQWYLFLVLMLVNELVPQSLYFKLSTYKYSMVRQIKLKLTTFNVRKSIPGCFTANSLTSEPNRLDGMVVSRMAGL